MPTTRGRLVSPNQVVFDQADLFHADGFTRRVGLTVADLTIHVYLNNVLQGWVPTDGALIPDAQVVVGKVYFAPIVGGPYNIRWRPNAVGYWRLVLTYPVGSQILAQDYDVTSGAGTTPAGTGLQTSFIKAGKSDC